MYSIQDKQATRRAFSLIESLTVISFLGILAMISLAALGRFKPAAEVSKLRSDVAHLNTAIRVYKHSGGDLTGVHSAEQVIAKLKTIRQTSTAQSFVGLTGSMVDQRLALQTVAGHEGGFRAVYDPATHKFEVTGDAVMGYRFFLNELEDGKPEEETRNDSVLKYASNSTWVWDYGDSVPAPALGPTLPTLAIPSGGSAPPPGSVNPPGGPASPVLQKLLPPVFSPPGDFYPLGEFPMTLALSNPNPAGSGKIVYGIISGSNWQWQDYSGPLQLYPGDKVVAYVESAKPQESHHSDPANQGYDWTAQLQAPEITAAPSSVDARTGSTSIIITHAYESGHLSWNGQQLAFPPGSFTVQYKLRPLAPGEGIETPSTVYNGPFDVGGPQFPRGFDVVARIVAHNPFFVDSTEAVAPVTAFYKLDAPVVTSNPAILGGPNSTASVTLSNPNPAGSSFMEYRVVDLSTGSVSGWSSYGSPFALSAASHPKGFQVEARAMPLDPYYLQSDLAKTSVTISFFGIEPTGKTIFVLDVSGSMAVNNRIERLKQAALAVINQFEPTEKFAVITYSSRATTVTGWGNASSDRKAAAATAINALKPGGSTNYVAGLQATINLAASDADQVIFLSDGWPNTTVGVIPLVESLKNQGIKRFDTVALGESQQILLDMAAAGGGKVSVIPD